MPNMKSCLDSHNQKIIKKTKTPTEADTTEQKTCNCQKKEDCPLKGHCVQQNVIYQASVTSQDGKLKETYVGLATNFKERYRNHKVSFNNTNRRNETELSKQIWTLKDNNTKYNIDWCILKKCYSYNSISKRCNLCLYEKFIIIFKPELCSLNKRNELMNSCRHRRRFLVGDCT